ARWRRAPRGAGRGGGSLMIEALQRLLEADQPAEERVVEGVRVLWSLAAEKPIELELRLRRNRPGDRDAVLAQSARGDGDQERLAAAHAARQVINTLRDQLVAGEVLEVTQEHGRASPPEPQPLHPDIGPAEG